MEEHLLLALLLLGVDQTDLLVQILHLTFKSGGREVRMLDLVGGGKTLDMAESVRERFQRKMEKVLGLQKNGY